MSFESLYYKEDAQTEGSLPQRHAHVDWTRYVSDVYEAERQIDIVVLLFELYAVLGVLPGKTEYVTMKRMHVLLLLAAEKIHCTDLGISNRAVDFLECTLFLR